MSKYINRLLGILIIVVVCLFSIGYSVLNRELNITGELNYRPVGDVRITNLSATNLNGAMINYADFSKNEIKLGYTTTSPVDVTYKVEVTNYLDVPMGILKIENLPNNAVIGGYTLGTKLSNSDNFLKLGEAKTFTITFKSIAGINSYLLKFDFEPVYKITYDGFSTTNGFKTEILKGDDYLQNFGSSPPKALYINMGGSRVIDYTYSGGTLSFKSINGDITITVLTASHLFYDNSKSGLNCDNVQCALDEINRLIS